jgi:alkanesulfonate monooxygenase SsuD/methylene tetrahydromethanopterin reductase-like flavin-dependent oxidoreductase (luciferase family)
MKKELIDEAIENARRDRARLEKVANALLTVSEDTEEAPAEGEEKIANAAASAAVSEELSKVTDSLTKINQSLIELVKHQRRQQIDDKLDNNDKDDVYSRLEKERTKSKNAIQ